MAADHGYDIDPDDDDFVAMCDCKPGCSTYLCTGCKERSPFAVQATETLTYAMSAGRMSNR